MASSRRFGLEHLMVWNLSGDRAHHFERVERRHALAGFGGFDAGERHVETIGRRADGESQQQTFEVGAIS